MTEFIISIYMQTEELVLIKWNRSLAYAVGLFTADGCLSSDGRHLEFCSKDREQVENFIECLRLTNRITKKARSNEKIKKYYRVQFGNKSLYSFFCSIGLKPRKSLTLEKVNIPSKFFADFLRGFFDGDGNFKVFRHPESQYPQIRVRFTSASPKFIRWLYQEIRRELRTRGFILKGVRSENLEYAIDDSIKLLDYMYYSSDVVCLSRKLQKVRHYFKRT